MDGDRDLESRRNMITLRRDGSSSTVQNWTTQLRFYLWRTFSCSVQAGASFENFGPLTCGGPLLLVAPN
jgi:hypothetical protein